MMLAGVSFENIHSGGASRAIGCCAVGAVDRQPVYDHA